MRRHLWLLPLLLFNLFAYLFSGLQKAPSISAIEDVKPYPTPKIALAQVFPIPPVSSSPTPIKNPSAESSFQSPIRLLIPSINVDTEVISVGLNTEGLQQVPEEKVSLFNSVLAGHYKLTNEQPGVFYLLGNLGVGEIIKVFDKNGKEKSFKITDSKLYNTSDFPTSVIYGSSDKRHFNLVTCAGKFDPNLKDYTQRRVIFTELST